MITSATHLPLRAWQIQAPPSPRRGGQVRRQAGLRQPTGHHRHGGPKPGVNGGFMVVSWWLMVFVLVFMFSPFLIDFNVGFQCWWTMDFLVRILWMMKECWKIPMWNGWWTGLVPMKWMMNRASPKEHEDVLRDGLHLQSISSVAMAMAILELHRNFDIFPGHVWPDMKINSFRCIFW